MVSAHNLQSFPGAVDQLFFPLVRGISVQVQIGILELLYRQVVDGLQPLVPL